MIETSTPFRHGELAVAPGAGPRMLAAKGGFTARGRGVPAEAVE